MNHGELLAKIGEMNVFRKGHFKLSYGAHTDTYVDKTVIYSRPEIMAELVRHATLKVYQAVNVHRMKKPSVVVAPAVAGIVFGYEIAASLVKDYGFSGLRFAWCERAEDGKMALKRGFAEIFSFGGADVLIAEDVITTGHTVLETAGAVEALGARVVGIVSMFNRGHVTAPRIGVPILTSVFDLTLPDWGNDCPLCEKKIPLSNQLGHG